MTDNIKDEKSDIGSVRISNDVVAIISGVAATEIKGVVGMSGGITGGITELLGMKNLSKGVKVEVNGNDTNIDLYLVVEYGSNIAEVGKQVQENVKSTVETMTGLNVLNINVNIQGVSVPKEPKAEAEPKMK